jgi:hypothetical protein
MRPRDDSAYAAMIDSCLAGNQNDCEQFCDDLYVDIYDTRDLWEACNVIATPSTVQVSWTLSEPTSCR